MKYWSLQAFVLLAILFAGTRAAVEDCGTANCTTADETCDRSRSTPLCKFKVGTNCPTNSTDCVTSATCTAADSSCLCASNFSASSDNKSCMAYAGTNCVAVNYCITGASCTAANQACTCGSGLTASSDNSKCLAKVGSNCTSSDCVVGATCTAGLCVCPANFMANSDNTKCLAYAGTSCPAVDYCIPGATCGSVNSACLCETNLTASTDKSKCYTMLEGPCSTSHPCVVGAVSPCSGTCKCPSGYTANAEKKDCLPNLGTVCNKDDGCFNSTSHVCDPVQKMCKIKATESCAGNTDKCMTGATCVNNTCDCVNGYTVHTGVCKPGRKMACSPTGSVTCSGNDDVCDPYSNTCKIKDGGSCASDSGNCTTGASCNSTCTCNTATTVVSSSSYCQQKKSAGQSCDWFDKCDGSDLVCDRNLGTCVTKAGASCNFTTTCVTGAKCDSSSHCSCQVTGFTTSGDYCVAGTGKAGGQCDGGAGGTCSDVNSECSASGSSNLYYCQCKTNYRIKAGETTCTGTSGSSTVTMTTGLVTLMALLAVYSSF